MAAFYAQYPASSAGSANASVGINGDPIPGSSTLVAGENPSGDQQPLQTDASGNLKVDISSSSGSPFDVNVVASVLPTGAATEAKQDDEITELQAANVSLTSIDTKLTSPIAVTGPLTDTQLRATPVPVSASALPLPAGAATEATLLQVQANTADVADATSTSGFAPVRYMNIAGDNGSGLADPLITDGGGVLLTKDTAVDASTASIDSKTPTVGQKAMAASSPVVIASDQSSIPVTATISGTVPISGTVTAVQPTGTNLHTVVDSGTVVVTQPTGSNLHVAVDSSALPTGAATAANQATEIASLASIDGKLVDNYGTATTALRTAAQVGNATGAADFGAGNSSAQTLRTVIASNQPTIPTNSAGKAKVAINYKDYSAGSVTTAAYVTLVASTSAAITHLSIFDSSGQAMIIAVGAAASEVDQIYVAPGGGEYDLAIPSGSRISIKALTATASSGYNLLNGFGV